MKVYLFYEKIGELAPTLYAFTNKKKIAQSFGGIRTNLTMFTREMSDENWRTMRDTLNSQYIIEERFITHKETNPTVAGYVSVYVTDFEATQFRLHMDEYATLRLGLLSLCTDIFDVELKKTLDDMGMKQCYDAMNECPMDEALYSYGDIPGCIRIANLWNRGYVLDELWLFLDCYKRTILKKRKEG